MTIEQIHTFCAERKIGWSLHAAEMMMIRSIERADVLNCLQNGEIIEDYPNSFPILVVLYLDIHLSTKFCMLSLVLRKIF